MQQKSGLRRDDADYVNAIRADLRWKNEAAARAVVRGLPISAEDQWMAYVERSIASSEIALISALSNTGMLGSLSLQ